MHLLYVPSTSIGYGRMGVKLAAELEQQGVDIDRTLNRDSDPKNLVCWMSVPTHASGWFKGQRTVILTMWETRNLPEGFRESLHNFDQVLVPSEQNLELFSRYHPNVRKVPLGVDTEEWKLRERKAPTDRFVFLHGGSGARKGGDLVYEAFRKLWPTEGSWPREAPRPTLIFKSPKAIPYAGERVEWVGGKISDEAERDLYEMAHCYVQPSRGEGWGLQPLQAIAQGLPTILTDAHGQAEFSHLGFPISAAHSKADYFIYGESGEWWEPSLDELCQQMEYVYNNYEQACDFAGLASAAAHRQYSWAKSAERFVNAIGKKHFGDYHGDGSWQKPDIKRYLVRVTKPGRAEVAGTVYQFTPGVETWEVADVKRILWEAGVLDPSCAFVTNDSDEPLVTDFESGLTESQLARRGDYSAAHGHCEACGQRLNTPGLRYEPEFAD